MIFYIFIIDNITNINHYVKIFYEFKTQVLTSTYLTIIQMTYLLDRFIFHHTYAYINFNEIVSAQYLYVIEKFFYLII